MDANQNERELAKCIYDTFNTPEGKVTLTWILDQCGVFATDRSRVDPSLVAFAGKLMNAGCMGIAGDAGVLASAILRSHKVE